jgi:uroporphyrinogen decarboxylase
MRQAGRYMTEYRAIREKHTLLEICRTPELAVEVTLQPVEAFAVDAAILFADILLPLEPMGAPFEFAAGEGPVIHEPVRDRSAVERLQLFDPEERLGHVLAAIRLLRRELDGKTPLIGFAGAPFTLASYLVEGGKSSHFSRVKRLMFSEPELFSELMSKLSEVTKRYLFAQVKAGAQAVQLFDSWVGCLGPADYRAFVLPHVRSVLSELATAGVPVIHFGTDTGSLLELQREAGGSVIGVDFRTPLADARRRLGDGVAVQGNLDPISLFAPREVLARRVDEVLESAGSAPGHVFNLGHGILPETSPDAVRFVADHVHEQTLR